MGLNKGCIWHSTGSHRLFHCLSILLGDKSFLVSSKLGEARIIGEEDSPFSDIREKGEDTVRMRSNKRTSKRIIK